MILQLRTAVPNKIKIDLFWRRYRKAVLQSRMYKAQQARLHLDKIKSLFEIIICKPNSDEPLCMTLMLSDYFIGHLLLFIMKYDACWSYINLSDIL